MSDGQFSKIDTFHMTPWSIVYTPNPTDFKAKYKYRNKGRESSDSDFFVFHSQLEDCFIKRDEKWIGIESAPDEHRGLAPAQKPHVILTTDTRFYHPKESVRIILLADGMIGKVPVHILRDDQELEEETILLSPAGMGMMEYKPPGEGHYSVKLDQGSIHRVTRFWVGRAPMKEEEEKAQLPKKNLIPFRTKRTVSLAVERDRSESGGLNVDTSGESDVPFDLVEAVGRDATIQFSSELWRVWAAVYSTAEGEGATIFQWDNIEEGDVKRVEAHSPLTAIEIFAMEHEPMDMIQSTSSTLEQNGKITGDEIPCLIKAHFAKGYVIPPPEGSLKFYVPETINAEKELTIEARVESPSEAPISVILSISDSRPNFRDIHVQFAKELWRNIHSYSHPDILTKDPEINAFRASMRHLMGRGRSVSGFLSLIIRTIAQRVGEDGITSEDVIEKKWQILTGEKAGMSNINVLSEPAFGGLAAETVFQLRRALDGVYRDLQVLGDAVSKGSSPEVSWDDFRKIIYLNSARFTNYWVYMTRTLGNVLDVTWFPERKDIPSKPENELARSLFSEVLGIANLRRAKSTMTKLANYFYKEESKLKKAFSKKADSELENLAKYLAEVIGHIEELHQLKSEWRSHGYEESKSQTDAEMDESPDDFEYLDEILDLKECAEAVHEIPEMGKSYHIEMINGETELKFIRDLNIGNSTGDLQVSVVVKTGADILAEHRTVHIT
jgi:hypothetical protein